MASNRSCLWMLRGKCPNCGLIVEVLFPLFWNGVDENGYCISGVTY